MSDSYIFRSDAFEWPYWCFRLQGKSTRNINLQQEYSIRSLCLSTDVSTSDAESVKILKSIEVEVMLRLLVFLIF
jgi:hypothetical protein